MFIVWGYMTENTCGQKRDAFLPCLALAPPPDLWHFLSLSVQLKPRLLPLQVRIWEIPDGGLKRNMTKALLELHGHSRRVGLVEWHPTTNNILFSAGYDYKVWGPGVGSLVRAGSVGDGAGEESSLNISTDMGPFGQSVIQSLSNHLLCTFFSWES